MQYQQGDHTVVSAAPLGAGRTGVATVDVPAALGERFYGRRFTRQQLEAPWRSCAMAASTGC